MGMQTFIDLLLAFSPGILAGAFIFASICVFIWGAYRGWTDYELDKKHQTE